MSQHDLFWVAVAILLLPVTGVAFFLISAYLLHGGDDD